jgi:HPt (histidine-containing phosphotransfer) domain-containing protein
LPDADGAENGARKAGIDAAVLDRLLSAMDPDDRQEIRSLCASDLERTRRCASQALRDWDPEALARHLHVMSSLAQTVGAEALADVAGRMQVRLRSGGTSGYEESARRMDELALRAVRFLAETAE